MFDELVKKYSGRKFVDEEFPPKFESLWGFGEEPELRQ